MVTNQKKSTPLTLDNLLSVGFVAYCSAPPILRMGNLYITLWNGTWQICNEDGCVSNEGNYNSIEELITRVIE